MVTWKYRGMLCSIARPAAGVTRSSQSPIPAGTTFAALSRNGMTTITTAIVIAAALRRRMAPRAAAKTAARASMAAVPTMTRACVSTGAVSRT